MSAESIINHHGDLEGWSDTIKLQAALDYIDNQNDDAGFEAFIEGFKSEIDDLKAPYDLTPNQKMFCRDAEDQGLYVDFEYSGRGMYGKKCPCVRVNTLDGEDFNTQAKTSQDSMGLGIVVYAPR